MSRPLCALCVAVGAIGCPPPLTEEQTRAVCQSDTAVVPDQPLATEISWTDHRLVTIGEMGLGRIVAEFDDGSLVVLWADEDLRAARLDPAFATAWDATFESTGYFEGAASTAAGETLGVGASDNDIYVMLIDADGQMVWDATHGSTSEDELATAAVALTGGGFVIAGRRGTLLDGYSGVVWTMSEAGDVELEQDIGFVPSWAGLQGDGAVVASVDGLARLDGDGALLEEIPLALSLPLPPASLGWESTLETAIALDDGGLLLAGISCRKHGEGVCDVDAGWAARIDAEGAARWAEVFGGDTFCHQYRLRDAELLADGSFALVGESFESFVGVNAWLVHLDGAGALLGHASLGESPLEEEYVIGVSPTGGAGYRMYGVRGLHADENESVPAALQPDLWSLDFSLP